MKVKEENNIVISKTKEIICDLCGVKTFGIMWNNGNCLSEITISMNDWYPISGTGNANLIGKTEIDLCADCFKNKLIKWYESQSGKNVYTCIPS